MAVKAITFDAFGTLFYIGDRRSPFRRLLKWGEVNGRAATPVDAARIMTNALDLHAVAEMFGLLPPDELIEQLKADLDQELSSVSLYPDAEQTVSLLQECGYRIGLCSNLAMPYGAVVKALLPNLDVYAMSYDIGAVKPDRRIYQYLVDQLGCAAKEVLFVGDTVAADVHGPTAFGMRAGLLSRLSGGTLTGVLVSELPERVGRALRFANENNPL